MVGTEEETAGSSLANVSTDTGDTKRRRKKKRYRLKSPFKPSAKTLKQRERTAAKMKQATEENGSAAPSANNNIDSSMDESVLTTDSQNSNGKRSSRKKKKMGKIFRKLVRGRSKKSGENSIYEEEDEYDHSQAPNTGLDPSILAKVVEDESFHSDRDKHLHRPVGYHDNNASRSDHQNGRHHHNNDDRDDYDRRHSKGDAGGYFDRRSSEYDDEDYDEEEDYDDELLANGERAPFMGPLSLVILLVDPKTLRFELLQLELDHPQTITIGDVLEQAKESLSEPNMVRLDFSQLMDREGNAFSGRKKKEKLEAAVQYRRRRKDLLVGLCDGQTPEEGSKLARPILADDKVVGVLQSNGFDLSGWVQDKKKALNLSDGGAKKRPRRSRTSQMLRAGNVAVAGVVLLFLIYFVCTTRFMSTSTTTMGGGRGGDRGGTASSNGVDVSTVRELIMLEPPNITEQAI